MRGGGKSGVVVFFAARRSMYRTVDGDEIPGYSLGMYPIRVKIKHQESCHQTNQK
jgi:hypothetical protein